MSSDSFFINAMISLSPKLHMISDTIKSYPELFIAFASFIFLTWYRMNINNKFPVNWPIVGMLPAASLHLHHLHEYGVEILRASNWTFRFKGPWFLGMDMVFTCDPSDVNHVFNTKFSTYPKGEEFAEIFEVFGESLLNTDGEVWRGQRKLIHSLMSNRSFRAYEVKSSREKIENALVPILENACAQGHVIDLQDVFLRLTFDTTCAIILGVDPGCLASNFPLVPFAKAMDDALDIIFLRHRIPKFWWRTLKFLNLGPEKRLATAAMIMDDFATQTIAKRKELLKQKNQHYANEPCDREVAADLLTAFMSLPQDRTSVAFDKFIKENALNLLLAGRDTTAATLTWFFWILSTHPHVEKKILKELEAIWPKSSAENIAETNKINTPFGHEELNKLVYLHAALCECLRLYPPVATQHKGVGKPDVLPSGQMVQPGTALIFHVYSMARMEGIWGKDCMEFRPERWITESGEIKHEPAHKFFAFNCGPRICLGKDMAFTKMKTVAAAILYNFHVQVIEGHVVEPKISIILHMKNGLLVKLTKREKNW